MRSTKRPGRSNRSRSAHDGTDFAPHGIEAVRGPDEDGGEETYEMFRVICPDCARPIALLADEDVLPEHAVVRTPWNPFGLTGCPGAGRSVAGTTPADASFDAQGQDAALLLTLPEGLDWRTQPFSHPFGAVSRPRRLVQAHQRAA